MCDCFQEHFSLNPNSQHLPLELDTIREEFENARDYFSRLKPGLNDGLSLACISNALTVRLLRSSASSLVHASTSSLAETFLAAVHSARSAPYPVKWTKYSAM